MWVLCVWGGITKANDIIKLADDTTVVVLIRDDDDAAYREEVQRLALWWQDKNLCLNVDKTKELIVDFRKTEAVHLSLSIAGVTVDGVKSTRFLSVHFTEDLSWTSNTKSVTKRARQ